MGFFKKVFGLATDELKKALKKVEGTVVEDLLKRYNLI